MQEAADLQHAPQHIPSISPSKRSSRVEYVSCFGCLHGAGTTQVRQWRQKRVLMRPEAAFPYVSAAEGAQHPPKKPPRSTSPPPRFTPPARVHHALKTRLALGVLHEGGYDAGSAVAAKAGADAPGGGISLCFCRRGCAAPAQKAATLNASAAPAHFPAHSPAHYPAHSPPHIPGPHPAATTAAGVQSFSALGV